jgi:hypothetical protein
VLTGFVVTLGCEPMRSGARIVCDKQELGARASRRWGTRHAGGARVTQVCHWRIFWPLHRQAERERELRITSRDKILHRRDRGGKTPP